MTRGKFVVLEGGDGSGKSTQVGRLATALRAWGLAVHETFEPGAGPAGAVIRDLLLHGPEVIAPVAEALLMAADRAQHVAAEIAPALERGEWVVCDRYVPSSLVYQGVVRGLGVEVVEELSAVATGRLEPDLVIVLDIPDRVAAARRGAVSDRLEREGEPFHAAVRRAYRELAATRGWVVVDADGSVDAVAADVRAAVEPLLAG
ncbi:MAG: dTMP kinase [Actinomycetota bacterium]|nr:dTMP kinase [Actinomycetota bacterium]